MAAVTLYASGTSISSANSADQIVTVTTTAGDLIVLIVTHTGKADTALMTVSDNAGGSYTNITGAASVKATSADYASIWVRTALVSSGASTIITVDYTTGGAVTSGASLTAYKITGMSRTGASAVRQSAAQNNQAAAGTPAPVFGSAVLTSNCVIGYVHNATNPATMTPRASFTELFDSGYATPTTGVETMSRDSGETGTTMTWGGTSATAFSSGVIELDTSLNGSLLPSWASSWTPIIPFLCR